MAHKAIKQDLERYAFLREYLGQLVLTTELDRGIIHFGPIKRKLFLKALAIQPTLAKIEGGTLDQRIDEWLESFAMTNEGKQLSQAKCDGLMA